MPSTSAGLGRPEATIIGRLKPRLEKLFRHVRGLLKIFVVAQGLFPQCPATFISIPRFHQQLGKAFNVPSAQLRGTDPRECCCSNRALHIPRFGEIVLGTWLSHWWSMRSRIWLDGLEKLAAFEAFSLEGCLGFRSDWLLPPSAGIPLSDQI